MVITFIVKVKRFTNELLTNLVWPLYSSMIGWVIPFIRSYIVVTARTNVGYVFKFIKTERKKTAAKNTPKKETTNISAPTLLLNFYIIYVCNHVYSNTFRLCYITCNSVVLFSILSIFEKARRQKKSYVLWYHTYSFYQ